MASSNTPKPEKKNTKIADISKTQKKKTKNAEISKTKKEKDIKKDENREKKNNKNPTLSNGTSKQRDQGSKKGAESNGEDEKMNAFPMNRIRTMIKGEEPDMRVSQEALFAINNAVGKFLEQFTQDAYAFCVQDRKKCLGYDHLAHVVNKQRRYDFLSDFVPEKVKAVDALRERSASGKGGC